MGHSLAMRPVVGRGTKDDVRDSEGDISLHLSAGRDYENVVRLLIDRGANAEFKDDFGCTPPMEVVIRRHERATTLLLEEGAGCAARYEGLNSAQIALEGTMLKSVVGLILRKSFKKDLQEGDCHRDFTPKAEHMW